MFRLRSTTVELRELVGSDGWNWGDDGDWVQLQLHCTTPVDCQVQTPSNPTASANNVSTGTSVTLSSSCAYGTAN